MTPVVVAIGFAFSVLAGHFFVSRLANASWLRIFDGDTEALSRHRDKDAWYRTSLGLVERLLFTASILAGVPEFIAVWFGVKVAAKWHTWRPMEEGTKKREPEKAGGGAEKPSEKDASKEVAIGKGQSAGVGPEAMRAKRIFVLHLMLSGMSIAFAGMGAYFILRWPFSGDGPLRPWGAWVAMLALAVWCEFLRWTASRPAAGRAPERRRRARPRKGGRRKGSD